MKSIFQLVIFLSCLFIIGCVSGGADTRGSGTSESLQHDYDISRLEDLVKLSGHVEEYKKITGSYPYEGDVSIPHYVLIATDEQQKYIKGGPPYEHKSTSARDFVAELRSVLGEIEVPFDLQRVPTNKPNFYIYNVVEDTYFVAVHVHNDFSFANKVGDFYHKVEVTNQSGNNRKGTWFRSELLAHPEFNAALQAQPYKPGYMDALREKLGGNNAF